MSDADRRAAASVRAAAPGSLVGLCTAVKMRMQTVAAAFWGLETKGTPALPGIPREPIIFDGWLPPKKSPIDQAASTANEQFPFIVVLAVSGNDSKQGADQDATAVVELIVGTYSDADDGYLDLLLIFDAIRQSLHGAPSISGTAYEHTGPLAWNVATESVRPQWIGHVTTNWTIPRPRRVEALNPGEATE